MPFKLTVGIIELRVDLDGGKSITND